MCSSSDVSLVVTVIIPAFGQTDLLRRAVESVLAQDLEPGEFEVIVVDSSPTRANAELIESMQSGATCRLRVFTKIPEGPGPSRNLGARNSRSLFLAFLDSDCVASPCWLREGLKMFSDSKVGFVQGRTQADPAAPHSVFNRSLVIETENHIYETANIFYRRKIFEEFGGFLTDLSPDPTKTLVGGEDVDLAWRVKRAGWKSSFAANALVTHAVFRMKPLRWFCEMRLGTLPMLMKNYPELRQFYYGGYFFDQYQAKLTLLLGGLLASLLHPGFLLLSVPYLLARGSQPSRTLKGPLRLLRAGLYFPRDLYTFGTLLAGSVRHRSLLL